MKDNIPKIHIPIVKWTDKRNIAARNANDKFLKVINPKIKVQRANDNTPAVCWWNISVG